MPTNNRCFRLVALVPLIVAACSARPPAATPADSAAAGTPNGTTAATDATPAPPGQTHYKWSKATEPEVAAALEKKFQEAAKAYVQLKRNDQLMFCKKYREMGSSIRTLHCITEAELRKQVEDSDELRMQMRNKVGKCVLTERGCSGQ